MHVRLVLEGGLANLYGVVWATCMRSMGVMVHVYKLITKNEKTNKQTTRIFGAISMLRWNLALCFKSTSFVKQPTKTILVGHRL